MKFGLFYQIQVPQAVGRTERGASHLGGAGPDRLRRGDGLRQRVVLRAPLPPGVVAQQRAGPDAGGGHTAHIAHPHGHRRGACAHHPPSAAHRGPAWPRWTFSARGPRRRRPGTHRVPIPADAPTAPTSTTPAACGRSSPRCCPASGRKRKSATTANTSTYHRGRSCPSLYRSRTRPCGLPAPVRKPPAEPESWASARWWAARVAWTVWLAPWSSTTRA